MPAQTAIRLATTGRAEVEQDFAGVAKAGTGAMAAIADASQKTADQVESAADRAAARQEASYRRMAAAAKIAAVSGANQDAFNGAVADRGNGSQFATVNLDRTTGGARAAAAAFQELFDREDAAAAAAQKLAAISAEAAAAARAHAAQGSIDVALSERGNGSQFATVNLDRSTGSARDAAAAFQAFYAEEEATATAAAKLRATINPLGATLDAFNAELRVAGDLLTKGAITEEEYSQATTLATARMRDASNATKTLSTAHGSLGASGLIADHVVRSLADSIAAGQSPTRALALEMPRLAEAISMAAMMSGATTGVMAKLAAVMSGPLGIAITAGISLLAVFGPRLLDSASASDQLKQHQEELGHVIDQTTGRITEQNRALLLNQSIIAAGDAKKATRQYEDARAGIAHTAYSDIDLGAAQQRYLAGGTAAQLAADVDAIAKKKPWLKETTDGIIAQTAAITGYARTAAQAAAQERLLSGTARPGDQRLAIGGFGPEKPDIALADAEAKLAAAKTTREKAEAQAQITEIKGRKAVEDGTMSVADYTAAMARADAAVNAASSHGDKHAATLAREAASQDASARAALAVAAAYLQSDGAGQLAEARRKAITDATKKGIDVEAEARRQIALSIADSVVSGAKSVSALLLENAARREVNDQVSHGALVVGQMNRALSDEAALRPLIKLQALAQGDALAALTEVIDRYRKALAEAHEEEAHGQALQAIDGLRQRAEDARLAASFAGDTSGAAELARARLDAKRQSDARGDSDGDRASVESAAVDAARAEIEQKRAATIAEIRAGQRDTREQTELQLGTLRLSATEQQRMLDRLQMEQKLRAAGVDLSSEQAQQILASVDAEDALKAKLDLARSSMAEINDLGARFIDDLTNPKGAGIKGLLKDIEQELLKLAAINPLKNLLTGSNLPTLGSVFGVLGGGGNPFGAVNGQIFTDIGSAGQAGTIQMLADTAPHFASGSEYTSGGMAWVGENGPELVRMPRGASVSNAGDTRRLIAAANDRGGGALHFHLEGAVLTQDLVDQMNAIGRQATIAGATGGAQMSKTDLAKVRRRSLVSR